MKRSIRWLTACMAGVMAVSLMGCGSPAGQGGPAGQAGETDGTGETEKGVTAMGRYMETSQTLDIGEVTDLVTLSDGRL